MVRSWSAVLASHNGERFVEQQVRSILDQTTPPVEVLIGDDASTDRTVQVVELIAASHPLGARIVLIRRDRALGVARNFEDLLRRATSEVVALSDQDDVWVPTRMEVVLARFEAKSSLLLLHHDAELVDAGGKPIGSLFESLRISAEALDDERHGRGFERLLRRNLVTGATAVLRRTLVTAAGPVPAGWIHDEWLAITAAALDGLDVDDRRLISYRQHDANQIGARSLGPLAALGRFAEDGIARNARLLVRAKSLVDSLARNPRVTEDRKRLASQKLLHEQKRASLSPTRLRRIVPALAEWRTGRYTQFGNGMPDLIRDLVQPRHGGSPGGG